MPSDSNAPRSCVPGEGLLPRQQPRAALDHGDLSLSEPAEGLGHLAARRRRRRARPAGAAPPWPAVAERLSQGSASASPCDRRDGGARAGRQHHGRRGLDAAGPAVGAIDLDRPSPTSRPEPRTNSISLSASHGQLALVAPAAGHVVAPGQGRRDVDRARDGLGRPGHPSRGGEHVARPDQGLGGDAAPVRALTADQLPLDERRRTGRRRRSDRRRSPRPDLLR